MIAAVPAWGWLVIAFDVALYVTAIILLILSANIESETKQP